VKLSDEVLNERKKARKKKKHECMSGKKQRTNERTNEPTTEWLNATD
jgi:hypothetical protein